MVGVKMNGRIKELIEKSYYECPQVTSYMWENHIVPQEQWTKFAELIIQECIVQIQISTARDPRDTPQYKQSVGHQRKIKEYFGIE